MSKDAQDVVEELRGRFLVEIDSDTLDAGLSKLEAAEVYQELADEFRNRALCLEREHEADPGDEADDG